MLSSTLVPLTLLSLPFSFMQCLWSAGTFVQLEERHDNAVTVDLLFCCLAPFNAHSEELDQPSGGEEQSLCSKVKFSKDHSA